MNGAERVGGAERVEQEYGLCEEGESGGVRRVSMEWCEEGERGWCEEGERGWCEEGERGWCEEGERGWCEEGESGGVRRVSLEV